MVIGVGTRYRGDDAAGLAVAQLVAAARTVADVIEYDGEPTGLLALWEGADAVWIADAAVFDAPPGVVRRLVVAGADSPAPDSPPSGPSAPGCGAPTGEQPFAGLRGTSTHALGVADALGLAATLGLLPPRVVIYAIRGHDFSPGNDLAPPVAAAAREAAALVAADVARAAARR